MITRDPYPACPYKLQGAYTHVQPRLQRCLEEERDVVPTRITYAGRGASASPSTGFAGTCWPMAFCTKIPSPRGLLVARAHSGPSLLLTRDESRAELVALFPRERTLTCVSRSSPALFLRCPCERASSPHQPRPQLDVISQNGKLPNFSFLS